MKLSHLQEAKYTGSSPNVYIYYWEEEDTSGQNCSIGECGLSAEWVSGFFGHTNARVGEYYPYESAIGDEYAQVFNTMEEAQNFVHPNRQWTRVNLVEVSQQKRIDIGELLETLEPDE